MSMDPYGSDMGYVGPPPVGATGPQSTGGFFDALFNSTPGRMLAESPGLLSSIGYSTFRGSNTLLRGGSKSSLFNLNKSSQGGFVRRVLQNNAPRPRNIRQFTDLSIFADPSRGLYSPFGIGSFLGNNRGGRFLAKKMAGIDVVEGERAFGPGLFSSISAGVRIDRLERKAAKGSTKAASRLTQVDRNLETLARMNLPSTSIQVGNAPIGMSNMTAGQRLAAVRQSLGPNATSQEVRQAYLASRSQMVTVGRGVARPGYQRAISAIARGEEGVRGNLMASSMSGATTGYLSGYARGALGYGGKAGLFGRAAEGAASAEARFMSAVTKAFGEEGMLTRSAGRVLGGDAAKAYLQSTAGKAFFRDIGLKGVGKLATSGGARMLAARGAALAIPGLQVVAALSFAYDIGQMMGEGLRGAINLVRDANVSLRGSINKPAFGMGYKDTEAAATSRARGVMAIQNSRLNMRSLLGSEAGMMAAHYG